MPDLCPRNQKLVRMIHKSLHALCYRTSMTEFYPPGLFGKPCTARFLHDSVGVTERPGLNLADSYYRGGKSHNPVIERSTTSVLL